MLKTYKGSCHCGKIRFEADMDLEAGTGKCNCSICTKKRNWSAQIKPDAFRLTCEEADLGDYQFGSQSVHHHFCRTCGVAPFGKGYVEEIGGHYVSVAIGCLDDVEPGVLAALPVTYFDGRNNNWWNVPEVTGYL